MRTSAVDLPIQRVNIHITPCKITGINTIVTDRISPEAVREAVIRYFSDDSIRRGCLEAIAGEKDRLSWKRFCSNLLDFYNSL